MPNREVAVVGDTTCSFSPESKEAQELDIHLLPVSVHFEIEGKPFTYEDRGQDPAEFYRLMKKAKELPTTDSSVLGQSIELYPKLAEHASGIIAIHASTGVKAAAVDSAHVAIERTKDQIEQINPELTIEVIDSKRLSLPLWWMLEQAAKSAEQGKSLEEIKMQVLEMIPQTQLLVGLSTYKNLVKGGRVAIAKSWAAIAIQAFPVLGIHTDGGEAKGIGKVRTKKKIPRYMAEYVQKNVDTTQEIVKLGVLHTNAPGMAEDLVAKLDPIYPQENIIVKDIGGSAISVHTGEGAVGVAFWAK